MKNIKREVYTEVWQTVYSYSRKTFNPNVRRHVDGSLRDFVRTDVENEIWKQVWQRLCERFQ